MSDKRLHVLINDEESIRWLESQDNMSASIRLLIQQVAREGLLEDYVMYCAQQAPSPFSGQSKPTDVMVKPEPRKEPKVIEESEPKVIVEQEKEPEKLKAVVASPSTYEGLDAEVVDEKDRAHINKEIDKSDESEEDIDWDRVEDQKMNRIDRMMADAKR